MDPHKSSAATTPQFTNHAFQYGEVTTSWNSPADNVSASFSPRASTNVSLQSADQNTAVNDEIVPITKRPRACEACRHLKVRCIANPGSTDGACRRTDAKVVELEKQIEVLKESLEESRALNESLKGHQHHEGLPDRTHTHPAGHGSFEGPGTQLGIKRDAYGDAIPQSTSPPTDHRAGNEQDHTNHRRANSVFTPKASTTTGKIGDIIDAGIVDLDTAVRTFHHYVNDLAPHLPIVVFSPGTTFEEVRATKPLLFLAIISICIGSFCPQKRDSLIQELTYHFADRIFIHAEKTLELVQALLVTGIWYFSPKNFDELTFYQLNHYAVVLCCDLGLNRRTKVNGIRGARPGLPGKPGPVLKPDAPETRRTWLGCYFLAINTAMVMRRPPLLRWNSYIEECIDILQRSPDALESDKTLIYWVKMTHIAEDIGVQFSMDDPLAPADITNPRIQFSLKAFERRLEKCRCAFPAELRTPVIHFYELCLDVYMHEIGMHVNHNVDDFRPPFVSNVDTSPGDLDTSAHINALTSCLTSSQEALDVFASIDPKQLPCLPTYIVSRTSYLAIVLIKLMNIVSAPHSRLAQIFKPEDLKVEYYLQNGANHLKTAGQIQGGVIPARFATPLEILQQWVKGRKEGRHPDGWLPNPMVQRPIPQLPPISSSRTKRMRSAPHLGDIYQDRAPHAEPLNVSQSELSMQAPPAAGFMPPQSVERSQLAQIQHPDNSPFYENRPTQARLPTPNSLHLPSEPQMRRQSDSQRAEFTVQGQEQYTIPARQSVPALVTPYPVANNMDATMRHNSYPVDLTQQNYYMNMNMQEAYIAQMMSLNSEFEFMAERDFSALEGVFQDPTYVASLQNF
ncbi:hypothetical protein KEM56_000292 [Ascosphaera pollenicola]|nr:hypothetical protein KEM56_000292 [Ascosphaera pollenicola]